MAASSINFDLLPTIPEGWSIRTKDQISSRLRGEWSFDKIDTGVYLSKKQTGRKLISGWDLREELSNQPVMGRNLLDFCLEYRYMIPSEWKQDGLAIFFWGTIYHSYGDESELYVHFLFWYRNTWNWSYRWLGSTWGKMSPALIYI